MVLDGTTYNKINYYFRSIFIIFDVSVIKVWLYNSKGYNLNSIWDNCKLVISAPIFNNNFLFAIFYCFYENLDILVNNVLCLSNYEYISISFSHRATFSHPPSPLIQIFLLLCSSSGGAQVVVVR
jgi:hypothetical protein